MHLEEFIAFCKYIRHASLVHHAYVVLPHSSIWNRYRGGVPTVCSSGKSYLLLTRERRLTLFIGICALSTGKEMAIKGGLRASL